MKSCFAVASVLLVFLSVSSLEASSYGRTKIQLGDASWWVVSSDAVTVYFPRGAEVQAESLLVFSERELEELSRSFDYRPDRPVPVIAYISPSSFRQTETISGELSEGIGGVTEFFKSRVVVPFTGSWNDYRHVVSHELNHAFVYDMLFQRSIENIIYSRTPLWALEGLAEYTSLGWDRQSDGEFKDMVIGEEIVSIEELGSRGDFLVYRQGQAIYHFIASRYGEERLSRFVHALDSDRGLEGSLDHSLGISVEQLDRRFQTWARETYWPRMGWQEGPDDLGYEVQDDGESICQEGTVLSADGERFAGVEQYRSDLALVVRSAYTGEVIDRYFRTGGIGDYGVSYLYRVCGFSPGGDSLVVARHTLRGDVLSVCSEGETSDLPVSFDLIRDPAWSPDGSMICFSAMSGGVLDLYLLDLHTMIWSRLTTGADAELHSSWRGDRLLFVLEKSDGSGSYLLEAGPVEGSWAGGIVADTLFFDAGGIEHPMPTSMGVMMLLDRPDSWNLFHLDLPSESLRQVSCLYRSIDYPSWSESSATLAFTSSGASGCGVFIGDSISSREVTYQNLAGLTVRTGIGVDDATDDVTSARIAAEAAAREDGQTSRPPDVEAGSPEGREEDPGNGEPSTGDTAPGTAGQYRIRPYSPRLTVDYVTALAGYDSYLGLAGYTQVVLSDVLAHHRVIVNADVSGDVADADAALYYINLRRRLDAGIGAFRLTSKYIFVFPDHEELIRDTDLGGVLYFRYPFTPGLKVEGEAVYRHIHREGLVNSSESSDAGILSLGLAGVLDNAQWGYVGPRVGSRLRAEIEVAPGLGGQASYTTVSADLRHYVWVSSKATLGLRLAGATSWGEDAQRFYLGGAVSHRRLTGEVTELDDLVGFYSNYGDHLRGIEYSAVSGRRYVSATAELRVPFVRRLVMDAPLPIVLYQARGVMFVDAGAAFDDPADFRGASTDGGFRLDDVLMGIGLGWRVNLGVFVLKHDIAWQTDLGSIAAHPEHYITFGGEF